MSIFVIILMLVFPVASIGGTLLLSDQPGVYDACIALNVIYVAGIIIVGIKKPKRKTTADGAGGHQQAL